MLGRRQKRWGNIKTPLGQCLCLLRADKSLFVFQSMILAGVCSRGGNIWKELLRRHQSLSRGGGVGVDGVFMK